MAFQVGCGDKSLVEQLGCIAQHAEFAKLRHAQVVGDLEGDEGMLFQEEHRVVLFADPLDGLEDDVDQQWAPDPARAGRAKAGSVSRSASALRPWRVPAG
jgi:hypothetical protein